jgi:hypothetical protein
MLKIEGILEKQRKKLSGKKILGVIFLRKEFLRERNFLRKEVFCVGNFCVKNFLKMSKFSWESSFFKINKNLGEKIIGKNSAKKFQKKFSLFAEC